MLDNAMDELTELSSFIEGMAACAELAGNPKRAEQLSRAAAWLKKAAPNVCGKGYFCSGGYECCADHK